MKNLIVFLFCFVLFSSCGKFEDATETPVVSANGFTWNLNGTIVSDSVHYLVNEIVLVEVLKDGQKISAEVNFGNGSLPTFGDKAADKYVAEGVYKLTATIKSVTPVVKLTVNVVIGKTPVVIIDSKETVVVKISGSFTGSTNTMVYGLNISNLWPEYDANSPIYVEASVPGKDWSVYTNATEIVIINGFKYVKWPVSCPNGNIRVGWYQYKTKDGLKVKSWAGSSESIYYKDGLPEFSVYNGENYKLGTVPGTTVVYTMKANDAAIVSGSTIKIIEGTQVAFKVFDASGNLVIAKYDNDGTTLTSDVKTNVYNTAGTYKVTATIGATVLTINIEVSKVLTSDSVVLIASSISGTTNSLTLGLRCDLIIGFSASLNGEAQGEMPGVDWKSYSLPYSEITTINGVKYFQWKISCINGKVRFGFLQGANWASETSSLYRQTDGLYIIYVKDAHIYSTPQ